MQLGLGWIFVGAYAVENGRSIDIALLRATSLYMCSDRLDRARNGLVLATASAGRNTRWK